MSSSLLSGSNCSVLDDEIFYSFFCRIYSILRRPSSYASESLARGDFLLFYSRALSLLQFESVLRFSSVLILSCAAWGVADDLMAMKLSLFSSLVFCFLFPGVGGLIWGYPQKAEVMPAFEESLPIITPGVLSEWIVGVWGSLERVFSWESNWPFLRYSVVEGMTR